MVLEFLIASTKLIFIFIALAVFVLSLLFKTMSGASYYYCVRDQNFLSQGSSLTNAIKIAERFKPVLSDIELRNEDGYGLIKQEKELSIRADFFRYIRFKRYLSDKNFN
jgi:hypothetical protein